MSRLGTGLLERTVFSLAVVGLAPLLLVPYLIDLNRAVVTEQVLRTHALAARSTAARVEAFLETLRRPIESLALNPQLSTEPRVALSQELLAGQLQTQPLIAGISLENASGIEIVRAQSRPRAEIVQAVLAAPGEEALIPRREFGTLWLRFDVPLPESRGKLRVVAEATPLEGVLRAEELGREAVLVVAGAQEGVIVASEPGVMLEAFPKDLVEGARSGRVSGASRYSGGAGEALAASAPIPGSRWFVLSRQPAEVAEEVAVRMRKHSLLAAGGVLLLVAALSFGAYRSVVRPLRDLVAVQRRIAPGATAASTGNEVEQLRAAFGVLERQNMDRDAVRQVFVGRYLVIELLGSGGMGSVFRGFDPKLQRGVALKTVRLDPRGVVATRAEERSTLLSEAITVAKFSHPNIVAVYDVEELGDAAFIAMELVEGVNLDACLRRTAALPAAQAVPLGAAVARGLAAAHSHGVVHRDVKPANVLLGRDGSIKVTDFGVARHVAADARRPEDSGLVYGTPGYISPEAWRGGGQTALGDLFALGAILYRCLAGRPAFAFKSAQAALMAANPGSVELLPPGAAPEEVTGLVMSLLQADPRDRYPQTASAVADWLERIAAARDWRWSWDALALDESLATGHLFTPSSLP